MFREARERTVGPSSTQAAARRLASNVPTTPAGTAPLSLAVGKGEAGATRAISHAYTERYTLCSVYPASCVHGPVCVPCFFCALPSRVYPDRCGGTGGVRPRATAWAWSRREAYRDTLRSDHTIGPHEVLYNLVGESTRVVCSAWRHMRPARVIRRHTQT